MDVVVLASSCSRDAEIVRPTADRLAGFLSHHGIALQLDDADAVVDRSSQADAAAAVAFASWEYLRSGGPEVLNGYLDGEIKPIFMVYVGVTERSEGPWMLGQLAEAISALSGRDSSHCFRKGYALPQEAETMVVALGNAILQGISDQ